MAQEEDFLEDIEEQYEELREVCFVFTLLFAYFYFPFIIFLIFFSRISKEPKSKENLSPSRKLKTRASTSTGQKRAVPSPQSLPFWDLKLLRSSWRIWWIILIGFPFSIPGI